MAVTEPSPTEGTSRTSGVRVLPPALYLAGLLVGLAADTVLPSPDVPAPARWFVGGPIMVFGLLLAAWFFHAFGRAGTPGDLRKPTTCLVTTGPFRFSRNPGYLSLTLFSTGLALVVDAPWAVLTGLIVTGVVDRAVIEREERYLRDIFGDAYDRYTRQTRRWL